MVRFYCLTVCCLLFHITQAQYKIDTSLRRKYQLLFKKLPVYIRTDKESFNYGLGILTAFNTDTLNKADIVVDTSLISMVLLDKNGKPVKEHKYKPKPISEKDPEWLVCYCTFKEDTLQIMVAAGLFSSFSVTTDLYQGKALARYGGTEREPTFKINPDGPKMAAMEIPATINAVMVDRKPEKGIQELYGSATVTTNGYYNFQNAWGFKNEYIHMSNRIRFYFKCKQFK
jgi:hypothetical protein